MPPLLSIDPTKVNEFVDFRQTVWFGEQMLQLQALASEREQVISRNALFHGTVTWGPGTDEIRGFQHKSD
jgi:hypothetical protein